MIAVVTFVDVNNKAKKNKKKIRKIRNTALQLTSSGQVTYRADRAITQFMQSNSKVNERAANGAC